MRGSSGEEGSKESILWCQRGGGEGVGRGKREWGGGGDQRAHTTASSRNGAITGG